MTSERVCSPGVAGAASVGAFCMVNENVIRQADPGAPSHSRAPGGRGLNVIVPRAASNSMTSKIAPAQPEPQPLAVAAIAMSPGSKRAQDGASIAAGKPCAQDGVIRIPRLHGGPTRVGAASPQPTESVGALQKSK